MFRRLRELWRERKSRLHPECLWKVIASSNAIEVVTPDGDRSSAPLDDVFVIVAQMAGDYLATDWWLLDGREGCIVAFPWGAEGEIEAINLFQQLPGFDFDELGEATRAVKDSSFVVWKRQKKA